MPILAAICALAALGTTVNAEAPKLHEPGAVVVNVTLADLERILQGAFRSRGGNLIEGHRDEVARGVRDLSYRAKLSDPALHVGLDGTLEVELDILEADLRIGTIERKLLRRKTRCEDTGVTVTPDRPVDVTVSFRLAIADGDLRILPLDVRVRDPKGFRLVKPTRCRNSLLPTWMLWWIGKPHLRKHIDRLDDVLLERLQETAGRLGEDDGLLARRWSLDGGDEPRELRLVPSTVDTHGGSVLLSLAGAEGDGTVAAASIPEWTTAEASHSFLGLSQSFVNAILRASIDLTVPEPRRPGGSLRKLFRSHAIYALIPGLRRIEARDDLHFTLRFRQPPALEFAGETTGATPGSALIRIRMAGLEIGLWNVVDDRREYLGSLEVADGRVGVVPYLNVAGGVSFELVENVWDLASSGIEFDEELVAATIQELVFGEAFQTSYDPVGRRAIKVGETNLEPRYFRPVGNYLVVGLSP